MNILLITAAEKYGGAEIYMRGLSRILESSGTSVYILCGESVAANLSHQFGEQHLFVDESIVWNWSNSSAANISRQSECVSKYVRLLKIDVAFLNLNWLNVGCGVIAAFQDLKIPLLVHVHLCPYKIPLTGDESKLLRQSVVKNFWSSVSKDNRYNIAKSIELSFDDIVERIDVIYNGAANISRFSHLDSHYHNEQLKTAARLKLKIPCSDPVILSVGRHDRQKGFEEAISVIQRLHRFIPDVKFIWVGGGDYYNLHDKMISSAGMRDVISLVSHTTEIEDFYIASDLFYMPTKYEGFSLAMLEAAHYGLPMLINDVSSAREFIPPTLSRCVITPLSVWEHTFLLYELLSADSETREAVSDALRRQASKFSQEDMYESMKIRIRNASQCNKSDGMGR